MPQKITSKDLAGLNPTDFTLEGVLDLIGQLVDLSSDEGDRAFLDKAFLLSEAIDVDRLDKPRQMYYHYFLANAWATKRHFNRFETEESWDYDQEELTKELYHLRKCMSISGFKDAMKEFQCQVYTNLGNHFSHVGRFVEAQEYWNMALKLIPDFPMALGNIGHGLHSYAGCLYDDSHRNIFMYHSHKSLQNALLWKDYIYPTAYNSFLRLYQLIRVHWPTEYLDKEHSFDYDLGLDKDLANYRKWCLENTLYINPLNDLALYNIACQDILHLPSMTVAPDDPPKFHSLFNQIKQEYGTARFLFYEGTQLPAQSYSDEDVVLVDTLEYAEYSYNLEKVKIAYRLVYSLFDKIAYLLNFYLGIGIERNRISFRGLWQEPQKGKPLRTIFQKNKNLALRGLYWLSKDLFDKEDAHQTVIEPEAKELAEIRNHVEHKSFKVVENGGLGADESDAMTYSIGRGELERKTLKQMKLIRSAIIYTSLAIHHEEQTKEPKLTLPFILPDMRFEDKL